MKKLLVMTSTFSRWANDKKIYKLDNNNTYMATESVTIPMEEYVSLKRKAKIADDALVQLKLSIQDLKKGRVSKF